MLATSLDFCWVGEIDIVEFEAVARVDIAEEPVCSTVQIVAHKQVVACGKQLEQAREGIVSVYRNIISDHLPRILESINISKIVETRIQEMDMKEAEQIILSVMKKELHAIVWLGALLGSIMGTIMTFINI